MNRENAGASALLVAILGAFMFASSPGSRQFTSAPTQLTSASARANQQPDEPVKHSAEALIDQFLDFPVSKNGGQNEPTIKLPSIDDKHWPQKGETDLRTAYKLRFLIATVPEPISPSLRADFDNLLDAIQQALQTDHYLIDRFDLPWKDKDAAEKPFSLGEGLEIDEPSGKKRTLIKGENEDEKRYETEPGVILFRKDHNNDLPDDPELLVLFLVGETPTRGVRKDALMNAFQQVSRLARWQQFQPDLAKSATIPLHIPPYDSARDVPLFQLLQPASDRRAKVSIRSPIPGSEPNAAVVRLLGPVYSGSADSIEITISAWQRSFCSTGLTTYCPTAPIVKIVSNSASAIDKDINFRLPRVRYNTVKVPQRIAQRTAITYLHNAYKIEPRQIAILSESSTAFGGAVASTSSQPIITASPSLSTRIWDFLKGRDSNADSLLQLKFPYHLADLRDSFGRQRDENSQALDLRPHNRPLPHEDGEESQYIVPPFSPRTAATNELVLANLLEVIAENKIRAVGILATDVEDRVLLAQKIRQRFPDMFIFIFGSDVIYLHSDVNPDLQGVLVFSSYPLFGPTQSWTYPFDPDRHPILFPNEIAETAYNATIDLMGDDRLDNRLKNMIDYAAPFTYPPGPPGYWVSVVGSDALWPISFLPIKEETNDVKSSYMEPQPTPTATKLHPIAISSSIFPTQFKVIVGLLTFFGIWPAMIVIVEGIRSDSFRLTGLVRFFRSFCPTGLVRVFGRPATTGDEQDLRLYQLAFHLVLITIYLLVAGPFYFSPNLIGRLFPTVASLAPSAYFSIVHLFILPAFVVMFFGLIVAFYRYLTGSKDYSPENLFVLGAAFFLLVLSVCWLIAPLSRNRRPLGVFFYLLRSVALGSRIATIVPLLFVGAGALIFLWCALRRLVLIAERPVSPSYLSFGESFAVASRAEKQVRKLLQKPLEGSVFTILAGGLYILLTTIWWPPGFTPLIDGYWFQLVFAAGSFVVYCGLLLTLSRFYMIWQKLREMLEALYAHPSRNAYLRFYDLLPETGPSNAQLRIDLFDTIPSQTGARISIESATKLGETALRTPRPKPGGLREAVRLAWPDPSYFGWVYEKGLQQRLENARMKVAEAIEGDETDWRVATNNRIEAEEALSNLTEALGTRLEDKWDPLGYGQTTGNPSTVANPDEQALELAEIFVASRVFDYLRQVLPQLQSLALFANAGLILMLLAVSSYPFPHESWLVWFSWLMVIASVAVVLRTFMQMNRDKVLSMLSGTTPGALNFNSAFLIQIFAYGLVPVLGVIGVQFPGGIQQVFGWFAKLGHS